MKYLISCMTFGCANAINPSTSRLEHLCLEVNTDLNRFQPFAFTFSWLTNDNNTQPLSALLIDLRTMRGHSSMRNATPK